MKKVLTNLTVAALIVSLTACSTNTREQNTVVGAGTGAVAGGLIGSLATGAGSGWVIAAGVVVGALIGGLIGNSMDSSDCTQMNTAMDHNAMNQPSNWQNHKSGAVYKVVPTSGFVSYRGNPYCRHYVAYGQYRGKTTETRGIACRMNDGMWKQVR
jgi:surface antigen